MTKQTVILFLMVNIFILGSLYIYTAMNKSGNSRPVVLVLDERKVKRVLSVDSIVIDNVWGNYPYLTLLTLGDKVPSDRNFTSLAGVEFPAKELLIPGRIYLRINSLNEESNFIIEYALQEAVSLNVKLIILINSGEVKTGLDKKGDAFKDLYFVSEKSVFRPDKHLLNYFFTITSTHKIENIYFPRYEVPQMTRLYLSTVVAK